MCRQRHRNRFWSGGLLFVTLVLSSADVRAGNSFTLVAREDNCKDMSVNLGADALRGDVEFGGRKIVPPSSVVGKEELIGLLNHDSGVLDIQHTFFLNAALSSRILLQFQTLQEELKRNCWTKEQASNLRATLRMFVIPPYGPDLHNRLWGISPTVHLPPKVGLDPPPISVPIGVFRQMNSWVEGAGQNSFFTATYDEQMLLDVKRVGVAGPNTTWLGEEVDPVDVCLNRQPGLEAKGSEGQRAILCYDESEDWQPWVEWDVSDAVRFWMQNDFDPALYHGFSLYQFPGVDPGDQIRISPEVKGFGRSRPVITFASSSGAADCAGAGGIWGGPGGVDFVYSNHKCMTSLENDMDPGDPFGSPRIISPRIRPEWAPQLLIETISSEPSCLTRASLESEAMDAGLGETTVTRLVFSNLSPDSAQTLIATSIQGVNADSFWIDDTECKSVKVEVLMDCAMAVGLSSNLAGPKNAELTIQYQIDGQESSSIVVPLTGTVSHDRDGIPDKIEDRAPNGGDGNFDNVPDRLQEHVASFANSEGNIITVAAPSGTRLVEPRQVEISTGSELPNFRFDDGFYSFEVTQFGPGAAIKVDLFGLRMENTNFHLFGPQKIDLSEHWFAFPFDGTRGVAFGEERLTIYLQDGEDGDLDLSLDGKIFVRGGPSRIHFSHDNVRLTDATVGSLDWLVSGLIVLSFMMSGLGLSHATSRFQN